jgi:hypothetical protein
MALVAGNLVLLGPWLFMEFSDQPWNNGYIYVGIARMFRDLRWTWNPLQYGGAPFRYLYPPLFHALIVVLGSLAPAIPLGRAVHLVAGAAYAATPACLYILGRQLFPGRIPALFAALAYSVLPSPVYALTAWRLIAHPFAYAPLGFVTLVAYDEVGHCFGLPLALLALAAMGRSRWRTASLLAGAVFLTNWLALIGLGFMVAGFAIARLRDLGIARSASRAVGVVGAAYGISAFWMTPGYFVSSTLLNRIALRHTLIASPWSGISWLVLGIALAVVCLCCWRRVPGNVALPAVWVALSGLVVVSYTLAGNYLLPSPHRYVTEFNAGLILLCSALLSLLPRRAQSLIAVSLLIAGLAVSWRFLGHAWKFEPKQQNPTQSVAYRLAFWLKQHAPDARVVAAGELDSTLNLWSDIPQVGGSGQDVSNFLFFAAERQIALGCGADSEHVAELWMRALNAPFVVVPRADSREYFHWYAEPERFATLPALWDDGSGDTVRRLPGFQPREAVAVDLAALARLPRLGSTADERFLEAYVRWAAGTHPVDLRWRSPDQAEIDAELAPGEAILVKENSDPGWHASGGTISRDPIGFQLIRAAPGQRHLTLRFGAAWDTWLGRAITLATIVLLLVQSPGLSVAACALVPAIGAWALLMASVPNSAAVAEDAFVRLHPPLINPGGIVVAPGAVISIYGLDLGKAGDRADVLVNDRAITPEFHGSNRIVVRLPANSAAAAKFGIQVNGCRGNEFVVKTQ